MQATTQFDMSNGDYERYQSTSLVISRDNHGKPAFVKLKTKDMTVCCVAYEDIDEAVRSRYELLKTDSNQYRFVREANEGECFDVSYFNAELSKVILLGRFTDEKTASFAHALARSDNSLRCVDNAAQHHIESLVQKKMEESSSSETAPASAEKIDDSNLRLDNLF